MEKDNKKITFFENIFYWLWHYSLQLQLFFKNYNRSPETAASGLVFLMKFMGVLWFVVFFNFIFNISIETILFGGEYGILFILLIFPISYFLFLRDEKKYADRVTAITQKMNILNHKETTIKKVTFFVVMIAYIIAFSFIWKMTTSHNQQYPIPVYKLYLDDDNDSIPQ